MNKNRKQKENTPELYPLAQPAAILILIILFSIGGPGLDAKAQSISPGIKNVISEYISPVSGTSAPSRTWKIVCGKDGEGVLLADFLVGKKAGSTPLCRVRINETGGNTEIEWESTGKKSRKSTNGILLIQGYPAPCDILTGAPANGEPYKIKAMETAGGQAFVSSFDITQTSVTPGLAKANGWIRDFDQGKFDFLTMIIVKNSRGNIVLKQLWPENRGWWIYEETPYRKSWLVDQEK